jgi:23S rRNA pseudouridine1911/1915/1917 synthase
VQVAIASGRPHQIRIHCAAVGAPLWGDPLYGPGGQAAAAARPGDGGYQLQAWRLELQPPSGGALVLEAPRALGLGLAPGG